LASSRSNCQTRRKLPARLLDTRKSGFAPLGGVARAISTVRRPAIRNSTSSPILKAERLDNVGGQANGEAITPLSTRRGAVPLRSTGLHI